MGRWRAKKAGRRRRKKRRQKMTRKGEPVNCDARKTEAGLLVFAFFFAFFFFARGNKSAEAAGRGWGGQRERVRKEGR